jgi:large subunit ribosomal protein L22
MQAFLKNYRQSPRKVRLVANLIKGKDVAKAITELEFLAKRAGEPMKKLLLSALANARQLGKEKENLFVKDIRVDKGIVMKRVMPAAMGSAHRINKRTSRITLILAEKEEKPVKIEKKATRKILHGKGGGRKETKESKKTVKITQIAKKETKRVVKKTPTKKK